MFSSQLHGGDCIECQAEIHKQHSDVGFIIFKVCDDWVEEKASSVNLLALKLA